MKKIIITSALFFALNTNTHSATDEQTSRKIIYWYNNTTNNCGGDIHARNFNGCRTNTFYPQQNRSCDRVGNTNDNQWITKFNTLDTNSYRIPCRWNAKEGQPNIARWFTENIASKKLTNNYFWDIHNEIPVQTWSQDIDISMPRN